MPEFRRFLLKLSVCTVAIVVGLATSIFALQPDIIFKIATRETTKVVESAVTLEVQENVTSAPDKTKVAAKQKPQAKASEAKPRIVSPDFTPTWVEENATFERPKPVKRELDPSYQTSQPYKLMAILGAGQYRVRIGKKFIKISLENVSPVPFRQKCTDRFGKQWYCGGWVRNQTSKLLRSKVVNCNIRLPEELKPSKNYPARCWFQEYDLAEILIGRGWGTPLDKDKDFYIDELNNAKRLNLGIWR